MLSTNTAPMSLVIGILTVIIYIISDTCFFSRGGVFSCVSTEYLMGRCREKGGERPFGPPRAALGFLPRAPSGNWFHPRKSSLFGEFVSISGLGLSRACDIQRGRSLVLEDVVIGDQVFNSCVFFQDGSVKGRVDPDSLFWFWSVGSKARTQSSRAQTSLTWRILVVNSSAQGSSWDLLVARKSVKRCRQCAEGRACSRRRGLSCFKDFRATGRSQEMLQHWNQIRRIVRAAARRGTDVRRHKRRQHGLQQEMCGSNFLRLPGRRANAVTFASSTLARIQTAASARRFPDGKSSGRWLKQTMNCMKNYTNLTKKLRWHCRPRPRFPRGWPPTTAVFRRTRPTAVLGDGDCRQLLAAVRLLIFLADALWGSPKTSRYCWFQDWAVEWKWWRCVDRTALWSDPLWIDRHNDGPIA